MKIDRRKILNILILSPALFIVTKVQAFFGDEQMEEYELDGDVAYEPDLDIPESQNTSTPVTPKVKPTAPRDPFDVKFNYAKEQIAARRFTRVIAYLEKLGVQKNRIHEAKRLFSLARAFAGKKSYAKAVALNERALALKPSLISSRFNNACYQALAGNSSEALRELRLLVDYIMSRKSNQRKRFLTLVKNDTDLTKIRGIEEYKKLVTKLESASW